MSNIEIEFRAMITKEKYEALNDFLSKNAEDLGEDNKDSLFYVLPDKLFKIVNETSRKTAKIVLKDSRIGDSCSFVEREIKIDPSEYEKAIDLFDNLGLAEKSVMTSQKRRNYSYQGVEVAVKFSKNWQYHVELEVMICDPAEQAEAERLIKKVADQLGITLMTQTEIKEFTEKFEARLGLEKACK